MNTDIDDFYPGMSNKEMDIRRRVRRLAEFYRHALVFAVINALLFSFNAWVVYQSDKPMQWYSWWAVWPFLGWGIGLLCHGISVAPMWKFLSQDWEDRKVRELMAREVDRAGK
jgi:DMSO reductase anchor subunit